MSTITDRFADSSTGKPPVAGQRIAVATVRKEIVALATAIYEAVPDGRNKAIAITSLEDVQMRANRGIFTDWDDEYAPEFTEPAPRFSVRDIASICHEANRRLQRTLGEVPNRSWESIGTELQASAKAGVIAAQNGATPEQLHESWIAERTTNGWVYGDVKDFDKKTHPCLVPYADLPEDQRAKDALFSAIVKALS